MEIKRLPITQQDKDALAKVRRIDPSARHEYVRRAGLDGVEEIPQIIIPPVAKIGKKSL